MLQRLFIQNYAIIERQEITFDSGLSIITGETGAGKSILLGALSLVMGQRADSKVLFNKEQKAIVEAVFTDFPAEVVQVLEDHDLDVEQQLTMRREILASGKSRAFVNDTPVRLDIMLRVSSFLLDMHKQFDTLEIQDASLQYKVLDAFAGISQSVEEYQEQYRRYLSLQQKIDTLTRERQQAMQERDFLEFQLEEFKAFDLAAGQLEEWENEYNLQENATDIKTVLGEGAEALSGSEQALIEQMRAMLSGMLSFSDRHPAIQELTSRLQSLVLETEDLSQAMYRQADTIDPDPRLKAELEQKIDAVRRLMLKHGVQTDEALLAVKNQMEHTLGQWDALNDDLEKAQEESELQRAGLEALAATLHNARTQAAPLLSQKVTELLQTLEMKHATLEVAVQALDAPGPNGSDQVEFFFTSNLGAVQQPIRKVASGGELSRLSLCIKSVVSEKMQLPTLIFDEIDTGVSGQVALRMGSLLKDLAGKHQVIMITHSPQIASRARQHLMVSKHDRTHRSVAEVTLLDDNGRIHEIAKMLSGDPPTEAAVLNAKELINV